ncbi:MULTISPECIES: AzlD domain-containing protein [Luteimonas]|uniref:AzlD domain-containing protein n=1 Tax=Luteimonas TaxID=83614 RepID=UPI000466F585|nr:MULTISPECIES: AzlD domain-containing protein [Luteimonas]
MSLWGWILLASAAAFATKLAGYLVPAAWLERPRAARIAATLTIGLLASLTAVNAFASGNALALDARAGALAAAACALALRVPFLGVVVAGAAAAALLRAAGVP